MLPARTALLISILVGVALEVGVALGTGRSEAWDTGVYWRTGLPLAVLAAATIGYLSAGRGWVSAILIGPAQIVAMMYRGGGSGNLWPLLLSVFLSLPLVLVAFVGRRLRTRSGSVTR